MLENRDYMRSERQPGMPLHFHWSATVSLMVVITLAFALQQINGVYIGWPVGRYLALTSEALRHGFVWQFLTFQFLHVGLWHLVCNLIGIWFFGRYVEERLGSTAFLKIYFLSGAIGGVFDAALGALLPGTFGLVPVVGASAGVFGLLAAFAALEPDAQILLFFFLPIRAKYLLIGGAVIALFFTLVPADPGIAHAAHLGGLVTGFVYVRYGSELRYRFAHWRPLQARQRKRELVRAASIRGRPWRQGPLDQDAEMPSEEFIAKEVDPILEKISAHGIQSLTERERRILEAARQRMVKR